MLLGLLPAASPPPCLESSELSSETGPAEEEVVIKTADFPTTWACSPALSPALLCSQLRPRAHIAPGLAVAGGVLPQPHPRVPGKAFGPVEVGVGKGVIRAPGNAPVLAAVGRSLYLEAF